MTYAVYARRQPDPWSLAVVAFDELSARREARTLRGAGFETWCPPGRRATADWPERIVGRPSRKA